MTPQFRTFFDAHILGAPGSQPDLIGGIVFDAEAPAPIFSARNLSAIIGRDDPRFPVGADVIHLDLSSAELLRHLKEPPAHWWPLCGRAREDGRPVVIHFGAAEYGSLAKGISRLARAYPSTHFLLDPFVPGKDANWKAGVCLADAPNVWITTRGLYGCAENWERRSDREAFYFVTGEVGAARLLFASGTNAIGEHPVEWLESIQFLDAAERDLILRENAREALKII